MLGVDPLRDQQLAGLIMWVAGGAVYLAAALWVAALVVTGRPGGPGRPALRMNSPPEAA
jgi:hypothetical protein